MIINCPQCTTNFLVKAEALGDDGRKVRCGKCAHIWFQKAPEPELVESEKEIIRQQQENLKKAAEDKANGVQPSLPVVVPNVPAPKWMQSVVILLVLINAFTFIIYNKQIIGQTGFYDMIGQYDTSSVIIDSAEISPPEEAEDGKTYYITWSVTNQSKVEKELPSRRIRLMDKKFEVVKGGQDDEPVKLKAGQQLKFDPNPVPNKRNRGRYIVVEIGNPSELSWR